MRLTAKQVTWLKVCLHLAGLLPFLWLVWAINHGGLGADPVKDIQHFTGRTALKFLLATLLITPLARYAKQPLLIRTRRLLGLWCFAWATLHLTSYALLELGVNNLALLGKELITRPYLTLGIISWVILLALAFTSNVKGVVYDRYIEDGSYLRCFSVYFNPGDAAKTRQALATVA